MGGRPARLERQVERMRRVWRGEKLVASALRPVEPLPLQPGGPPVLAGSIFPQSIERAARWADGILGFSFTVAAEEVGAALERARRAWTDAGRATPPRLVTGCWFALGARGRAQMDEYLARYLDFLGRAAEHVIPQVPTTTAEALRDAVRRARDAGADEIARPRHRGPRRDRRVEDLF
jgi:hypothetical protein